MKSLPSSPRKAVYAVIFDKDRSNILLVERRDLPVFVLPGGGIDPGETPEQSVLREVFEETGCMAKIIRKIAEYQPVNRLTQLTYFFECTILAGTPIPGPESKSVRFFPVTNLPYRLPPPFPGWITDALSNSEEVLIKPVEGVTYRVLFTLLLRHPILVLRYLLTKIGIRCNDNT